MAALRVVFSNITWISAERSSPTQSADRAVRVRHSCLHKGVWRCLTEDVGDLNMPLLFAAQGSIVADCDSAFAEMWRGRRRGVRILVKYLVGKLI